MKRDDARKVLQLYGPMALSSELFSAHCARFISPTTDRAALSAAAECEDVCIIVHGPLLNDRIEVTVQNGTVEQLNAFVNHYAKSNDLSEVYVDFEHKQAGGYSSLTKADEAFRIAYGNGDDYRAGSLAAAIERGAVSPENVTVARWLAALKEER